MTFFYYNPNIPFHLIFRLSESNFNNATSSKSHQPNPDSREVAAAQRIFTLKNFANKQPFEPIKSNKQQQR